MAAEKIAAFGIVPVVRVERVEEAVPLAEALMRAGLPCAEITFRTDAAEEALRRIAAAFPSFFLAAGTVLSPEQAERAMAAGASAVVSPGLSPQTVEYCLRKGYPVFPGVCTPTEVQAALSYGLTHLKFFPAEAAGGLSMLRAMSAVYPGVRFMPTGGITLQNLEEYLRCRAVFACGGSFMVPPRAMADGAWDEIETLTREAVERVRKVREVRV